MIILVEEVQWEIAPYITVKLKCLLSKFYQEEDIQNEDWNPNMWVFFTSALKYFSEFNDGQR